MELGFGYNVEFRIAAPPPPPPDKRRAKRAKKETREKCCCWYQADPFVGERTLFDQSTRDTCVSRSRGRNPELNDKGEESRESRVRIRAKAIGLGVRVRG